MCKGLELEIDSPGVIQQYLMTTILKKIQLDKKLNIVSCSHGAMA